MTINELDRMTDRWMQRHPDADIESILNFRREADGRDEELTEAMAAAFERR